MYSVEQVAERLGLHVRTVRNYVRTGRLRAVRIGKQYRIARADLEELTGGPATRTPRPARRRRHVEVSSVVAVDAIDQAAAGRVANTLMGATANRQRGDRPVRIETIYDEERASMRVVVLGGLADTVGLLRLVGALVAEES